MSEARPPDYVRRAADDRELGAHIEGFRIRPAVVTRCSSSCATTASTSSRRGWSVARGVLGLQLTRTVPWDSVRSIKHERQLYLANLIPYFRRESCEIRYTRDLVPDQASLRPHGRPTAGRPPDPRPCRHRASAGPAPARIVVSATVGTCTSRPRCTDRTATTRSGRAEGGLPLRRSSIPDPVPVVEAFVPRGVTQAITTCDAVVLHQRKIIGKSGVPGLIRVRRAGLSAIN